MAILDQLQQDLKQALKNSEESIRDTVRLILSQIKNRAIEVGKDMLDLADEEVVGVLKREIKKRREAIEAFEKGGRAELAGKEKQELAILEKYTPAEMTVEEIEKIVTDTLTELGGKEAVNFGQAMQAVMKKTAGRADGKLVSECVKKILS